MPFTNDRAIVKNDYFIYHAHPFLPLGEIMEVERTCIFYAHISLFNIPLMRIPKFIPL